MTDYSRARAVRLAFFVDPSDDSVAVLDDLFATCYGLYGGRYSAIIPVIDGAISDAYWQFLEACDADIVYSYAAVGSELERQIHERLYPSHLVQHRKARAEERRPGGYRPHLPFQLLLSLSVLPAVLRSEWLRPDAPLHLIDGWQGQEADRFVMDNFGTRAKSFANWRRSYPERDIVRPMSFVSEDTIRDERRRPGADDAHFMSTTELLSRMSKERVTSVAQLSAAETRRLDYRDPRWCEAIHVFVGSDFYTRLAFWNSRHLMPAWLDGQLISWRVSASDFNNEGFAPAFVDILQRNGHVRSSGGGSPHVRFWSVLSDSQEAETVIEHIKATRNWFSLSLERLASLDDCTPSAEVVSHAPEVEAGKYPINAGSPWVPLARREISLAVSDCAPQHLDSVSAEQRQLREGSFAIDCDIERSNNLSMFSNVTDRWRLGRRVRVAGAFVQDPERGIDARANRHGLLTVFGNSEVGSIPAIAEPQDDNALRMGLIRGRPSPLDRHTGERPVPEGEIAFEVQRSDCGKYLLGVIEQFGGLKEAQDFALHPFWAGQFSALGATPTIHARMIENLSNKLAKRAPSVPRYDITSADTRRELAEWALREASQERRAPRFVQFDVLRQAHDEICREYVKRYASGDATQDRDEERQWRADLTQSLEYLCQRQVMHQGYQWSCRHCLHKNWVSITALSREFTCGVCGHTVPAPVDRPWQFRLNEFVQRAMRDHGVGALLWALRALQEEARHEPIYFMGPSALYYSAEAYDARQIDAEIDLLVVCGTTLVLVEAKNSVRELHPEQVLGPARRIRPNKVVVAIMERGSTAATTRVDAIRKGLQGMPTTVELITLDELPLSDDPWLPGVRGRRTIRVRFI